jgi:hypothetical protein
MINLNETITLMFTPLESGRPVQERLTQLLGSLPGLQFRQAGVIRSIACDGSAADVTDDVDFVDEAQIEAGMDPDHFGLP